MSQTGKICYNKDVMKKKMTSFFVGFLCLAVLFLFLPFLSVLSADPGFNNQENKKEELFYNDRILVKFKNIPGVNLIKVASDKDFAEILKSYQENSKVEYAEPDFTYQASLIPSDTDYGQQWYLEKIKAPAAWDKTRKSPNIIIAIIDSGVQIDHPDLSANTWKNPKEIANNGIDDDKNGFIDDANGWDFVANTFDPSPKFEEGFTEAGVLHGTIVAGVAAASGNNATGVAGVTWRAQIMSLRVLDDHGQGRTSEVIRAIDYAINNGADIINFSFTGFGYSQALDDAVRRAYEAGIVIVAAAGNEVEEGEGYSLDKTPMYPACHDGNNGENMVIGVAATDTLDQKADFSSFGFRCVDITAPGVSIYSTSVYAPNKQIDNKYFNKYYDGFWSGTSMATPMVAGAAALVAESNPGLGRDKIIENLLNGTDNVSRLNPNFLGQLGRGRLNVRSAIDYALDNLANHHFSLVVSPYSGRQSQLKITDQSGEVSGEFDTYGQNFLGGTNLAAGDVDGDGLDEIIAGAGFGGGPHVRIFNQSGNVLYQFFAYGQNFRGGVNVAAGDVDGDGLDEIIAGAGFGGGPQVRIFNSRGEVEGQFFAYDKNFRGGVKVAVADIDGGVARKRQEIITAPGPGGGPHIRIFDNHANVRGQFFAYDKNFRGGVNIAAGDIDKDGLDEIITGAGPGGTPHVRVFETDGRLISSFLAYENDFTGGVNVGVVRVK